ncbi:MAG: dTDP-4-dehydrorhamnose 3,5-epimerase [Anaerolineales bacterium]|nr:dTDP-4-dehydrorhamnose 3,5-epimerase [Anaerolineales bacterium]
MKFTPTTIPDVIVVEASIFKDERGFFMETFQARKFAEAGISSPFVQDNYSGSFQGTLRGLHYQVRQAQGKLIRAVIGEVFDVVVDLRRGSPTFGKLVGKHLSARTAYEPNPIQLWVPPGFAHGFYVLSDFAEIVYKVTDFYAPKWERTLLWNDPDLGIEWPFLESKPPLISPKDTQGKPLAETDLFD